MLSNLGYNACHLINVGSTVDLIRMSGIEKIKAFVAFTLTYTVLFMIRTFASWTVHTYIGSFI